MRRALAALCLCLWVAPAAAYHEGSYPQRVNYCAMIAYALVEAVTTYREGIAGATKQIANEKALDITTRVTAVETATRPGVVRASGDLKSCLDAVEKAAAPDAAAFAAATALETELEFAVKGLESIPEAVKTAGDTIAARGNVPDLMQIFVMFDAHETYAKSARTEFAALLARAKALTQRLRAPEAQPVAPGVAFIDMDVTLVVRTADQVNARAGPSTNAAVLGQVKRGERVIVTGRSAAEPLWYRVQLPESRTGYVLGIYLGADGAR